MASETTAAATDAVGVVRRDPMAMKPFAGYNFGDYWAHWIDVGAKLKSPPQIFHVNWFRQDDAGKFLWPGFGENLRVLRWIIDRSKGERRGARDGHRPSAASRRTWIRAAWISRPRRSRNCSPCRPAPVAQEFEQSAAISAEFGERVPQALRAELERRSPAPSEPLQPAHSSQM